MTVINLTTIKKANEYLPPCPIAASDLSEKDLWFRNGRTMFEGYAEEAITEEEATAFCNVNLIGLHSVHITEEGSSFVMFQVWNIG
jgi:hypothetical protein